MKILFYSLNLFVVILWTFIIFKPSAQVTARLSSALWPFFILATYYLLHLVYTMLWYPISSLEGFFAIPTGLYAGWAHYLMVDFFVGLYIYRQTSDYDLPYMVNQALTLMAAPLGLMLFLYRQNQKKKNQHDL